MGFEALVRALWVTPEKLDGICDELLGLAPDLGTRLELSLFDRNEDADTPRTLYQLALRTVEWDPEHRAAITSLVKDLDRRILEMCKRAGLEPVENCVMLVEVVAAWIGGRATLHRSDEPPPDAPDAFELSAMGTQIALAILAQSAKVAGDLETAKKLMKHVPVPKREPTRH